jgi:hypothetical protein
MKAIFIVRITDALSWLRWPVRGMANGQQVRIDKPHMMMKA